MGFYSKYIIPKTLDFLMQQKPIMMQRRKVVPRASGRVLEIGIGSGLNLSFYDQGKLEKLWGLEPSPELCKVARRRADLAGIDLDFVGLTGEEIPMDSDSVDTVLFTYVLCTIPDAPTALREMNRVLKPGGQMIFCEHGRAPDSDVVRWQDRINGLWRRFSGGCNINRPIPELIREGGFKVTEMDTMYLPGPRPLSFNFWGTAVHG